MRQSLPLASPSGQGSGTGGISGGKEPSDLSNRLSGRGGDWAALLSCQHPDLREPYDDGDCPTDVWRISAGRVPADQGYDGVPEKEESIHRRQPDGNAPICICGGLSLGGWDYLGRTVWFYPRLVCGK